MSGITDLEKQGTRRECQTVRAHMIRVVERLRQSFVNKQRACFLRAAGPPNIC